jgi:hypothetical protein
MSVKTAGVGHFQIPTAPAAGTSVTSGAANTYTASAIQLIASTAAALYITGVHVEAAAASAATYKSVQLMIGAGGSETNLGQYLVPLGTGSTVALGFHPIFPPIPVASGQRLSVKTADSVGSQATLITLECIAQSNVVDDGIAVGTVTTVTNQLTAAQIATGVWQDTTAGDFTAANSIGKSVMNGVALGTGLTINAYTGNTVQTGDSFARLGAPVGASHSVDTAAVKTDTAAIKLKTDNLPASPASTTNITAGTITTVTTLTNLPAITANWLTAAGIAAGALDGKGNWNIGKTGYALSAAGVQAIWDALTSALTTVGSIGKKLADWAIGTAQTGDAYARLGAPSGASVSADIAAVKTDSAAIKLKTDNLPASPAAVGSAMTLTSGERTSIANEVEAQIIDETDSEKVLTAITDKIAAVNPSLGSLTVSAIAAGVRTNLTTELGRIDAAISTRGTGTALDAAGVRSAVGLVTANLDTQLGDVPTNSELAVALASADDAVLSAIGGLNNLSSAQAQTAAAAALTAYDPPTRAEATTDKDAVIAQIDANEVKIDAVKLKTDNLPADPADASDVAAAFSTVNGSLSTIAGYIDTEVGAIKAKTDQLNFAVTGKVDANITHINETEVAGDGQPGTEWNPV